MSGKIGGRAYHLQLSYDPERSISCNNEQSVPGAYIKWAAPTTYMSKGGLCLFTDGTPPYGQWETGSLKCPEGQGIFTPIPLTLTLQVMLTATRRQKRKAMTRMKRRDKKEGREKKTLKCRIWSSTTVSLFLPH